MTEPEEKKEAVKDNQGNWWYQDRTTASWHVWIGQEWKRMPGAAPRIAPEGRATEGRESPISWSSQLTAITGCLIAIIVVGAISLVAYNFFSAYHLNPGQGDSNLILKYVGGGLLVTLLGFLMLNRGFRNILMKPSVDDEWSQESRKPNFGEILNGLGQLFFGILFLMVGLGLMTVGFYQEVLPWLGL